MKNGRHDGTRTRPGHRGAQPDIVTNLYTTGSFASILTVLENGTARASVPVGGPVYGATGMAVVPPLTSLHCGIPIKAGATLAVQLSLASSAADHQITVSGYVW